jgi:glycosyltransferase involved in cell wall biosynthesis
MSLKILLSIHHNLDPNAGAPGATLKLGEEYHKLGHRVYYYSFDNLPSFLSEKAKFILFPLFFAHYLFKYHQKLGLDVIDTSTGDSWVWGYLRYFTIKKKPHLLVTRAHGLEHSIDSYLRGEALQENLKLSWKYKIYRGGFHLWEVSKSLRNADMVLQLNQNDYDYSVRNIGISPEKMYIAANGIPDSFLKLKYEPTPFSEGSTINIALIATYIPRKGIQYSIPALNEILNQFPYVKVSFLGTCTSEQEVFSDFKKSLHKRINVVTHYNQEMLPHLLKDHQIKLFPSLSEGFSLALLEAMACGLAPVASAISGSSRIVRDGHNGILIPPRDCKAIVQAIELLLKNRDYLSKLRNNAFNTAQDYGWKKISQDTIKLYERALNQNRS